MDFGLRNSTGLQKFSHFTSIKKAIKCDSMEVILIHVCHLSTECGGEYTAPYGTIRTPTRPDEYHHNANCSWLITVEANRIVELK